MHIQPFQALYPDMGLVSSADHFFSTVKEKFNEYWESGFYKRLPQDGLYIHQIVGRDRLFTGLVACIDIADYLEGCVKRHENTLAASEQEQVRLLLGRSAQVKPVLLAYRGHDEIQDELLRYAETHEYFLEAHFEAVEQVHRFWEVQEGAIIQRLQRLFNEKVPVTYIADGHHRTSSTALMYDRFKGKSENPFRWLPCSLFPTSELEIHDFNRIIEGLNDFSPTAFMAKISRLFEIEVLDSAEKPRKKFELTLFLDREWYRLNWRAEVLKNYQPESVVLDVSLLDEKVLKDILDIQDVKTDTRVKYHQGIKSIGNLKEKTLKGDERLAFCLYPVSFEDFLAISDAGGVLPPKSTWFEPRLRSGLLVRRFQI